MTKKILSSIKLFPEKKYILIYVEYATHFLNKILICGYRKPNLIELQHADEKVFKSRPWADFNLRPRMNG